jgi:hypothetical protein
MNRLSLTTAFSAILIFVAWLATPAMSQTSIDVEFPDDFNGDFGEVEVGISSSIIAAIFANGPFFSLIEIMWLESSTDFATDILLPYSDMIVGSFSEEVEITYTPLVPEESSATLLISISDLFAEQVLQVVEVELTGTGVGAEAEVTEIDIDIKPGGNPDNINLKSKGVVPVAVLTVTDEDSGENFDASTIDPRSVTVTFEGSDPGAKPVSPVRWKIVDVNDDGDEDMLFHFKTQGLAALLKNENDSEATLVLTGETIDEQAFEGTDTINIVPQR